MSRDALVVRHISVHDLPEAGEMLTWKAAGKLPAPLGESPHSGRLASCPSWAVQQTTRRAFLSAGILGSLGFSIGGLQVRSVQGSVRPAIRWPADTAADSGAVIVVFFDGGLSQVDSFDPKPDASSEIRGEFQAIATNVKGVYISELWPEVAAQADKFTFIRSMTHGHHAHERAWTQTCMGMPPIFGWSCTGGPPLASEPDDSARAPGLSGAAGASIVARRARNLRSEPESVRDAYGHTAFGRLLLRARQWVEAGARFVAVRYGGWDLHADIHRGMRAMMPTVDRGLAALVRDLADRGVLDRTLVLFQTEFGRTARINKDRGRDHWPGVYSIAFAGGGSPGGRVIGSSSLDAAEPKDHPVTPGDIAAMVCGHIGPYGAKSVLSEVDWPPCFRGSAAGPMFATL